MLSVGTKNSEPLKPATRIHRQGCEGVGLAVWVSALRAALPRTALPRPVC